MTDLFLPFTEGGKQTELIAIEIKDQLGLGPYDSVDPSDVLTNVPARLVSDECIASFPADVRSKLFDRHSDEWSAVGLGRSPIDGAELILLNHTDHPHRRIASLMEEIIHIVREHPRVPLNFNGDGNWVRLHDNDIEDEAYNVGAACIIPYRWLFHHLNGGNANVSQIAQQFGVSQSYVKYRINRAGLYKLFNSRRRRCGRPTRQKSSTS